MLPPPLLELMMTRTRKLFLKSFLISTLIVMMLIKMIIDPNIPGTLSL